jgi:hypothetical protein
MSRRKKAKYRGHGGMPSKKIAPPPVPVKPLAAPKTSLVPPNLCSRQVVQQGFAAFAARPPGAAPGTALISIADAAVASPKTLAAESLVHATEGWRFLSSALTALLAHSEKQALHFAYYAELRAVVSILASYGLRVRYPHSSYLEVGGSEQIPSWKSEGTHRLVWRLWSDWALTTPAEALFLDGLRVHPAVSLRHFKDAISQVSASANLTAWARDLQLDHEHTARNNASYEAGYSRENLSFMDSADFDFVRNLWALAEPSAIGLQFEVQLVHWMLKAAAAEEERAGLAASGHAGAGAQWTTRVMAEVERVTGVPVAELETALSMSAAPSPIFGFAFDPVVGAKNIASRAFFLLRLSTLPISSAFAHTPNTLGKTWVREWLKHAGLFDPTAGIAPIDVWADFEHLAGLTAPAPPLPAQLWQNPTIAQDTLRLGRPDAVMAWSVSL